jgi:hypothetical protein
LGATPAALARDSWRSSSSDICADDSTTLPVGVVGQGTATSSMLLVSSRWHGSAVVI